jgi:hypothetical protein
VTSQCHDQASRFVHVLTRGKSATLAPEDFVPLVQDVVDTHPGLSFLKEATEFHSRYVHTVSIRSTDIKSPLYLRWSSYFVPFRRPIGVMVGVLDYCRGFNPSVEQIYVRFYT